MPVTRKTNSQEKAYAFLKDEIVSLALRPGSPIRTQEIASKLKLSRTPVLQALSRLEQDGFVRRDGGWGYVVHPISQKEILDLFRIRESLEVQAAVEATPNLTNADYIKLASILDEMSLLLKEDKFTELRLKSREFHLLIAAASENQLLYRLLMLTRDRVLLVAALHQNMRQTRAREVLSDTARIYRALRSRNLREVKSGILAHIRGSRKSLLDSQEDI